MTDFSTLLQQGAANAWLFIPSAILLGALHGLEPGHSKTLMTAFIVAVRGTIWQAVLLGLCAAFSHSLVIWGLAAAGLAWGQHWNAESTEPYFQMGSGALIIVSAVWMAWRTRRDVEAESAHAHGHTHSHGRDHGHSHGDSHSHIHEGGSSEKGPHGGKMVHVGHSPVELSIFETGIPPRFELRFLDDGGGVIPPSPDVVALITTIRPDGSRQEFSMMERDGGLYSPKDIPEPHEFTAEIKISHHDHVHLAQLQFSEADHDHAELDGLSESEYEDAHERGHSLQIQKRFANQQVSTAQIMLFGLTGGLMPCPAALTVLLLCLQLKKFTLGFALVLCFSLGLALTLVATGVIAAWSVQHASKRFKSFSRFVRRVPYFSSAILLILGLVMIGAGLKHFI